MPGQSGFSIRPPRTHAGKAAAQFAQSVQEAHPELGGSCHKNSLLKPVCPDRGTLTPSLETASIHL